MDLVSKNEETHLGVGSSEKENVSVGEVRNNSHDDIHNREIRLKEKSKSSVAKTLSSPAVQTGRKPGVILLGRGNSFSLGRSEVIVLHHRQKPSHRERLSAANDKKRPSANSVEAKGSDNHSSESSHESKFIPLQIIEESQTSRLLNSEPLTESGSEKEPIPSSPPPSISNGTQIPHSQYTRTLPSQGGENEDRVLNLDSPYKTDLDELWDRVESVMAHRKDRVRMILEEYGIGEPGGGGGGEDYDDNENNWENPEVEERKKEEEEMWQVIEDSVEVQV